MENNVDENFKNKVEEAKGQKESDMRDAQMHQKIPQLAAFLIEGWESQEYQDGHADSSAREMVQLYIWYVCRRKAEKFAQTRGGETVTNLSNQYYLDISEKMLKSDHSARITKLASSATNSNHFLARINSLVDKTALDEYRRAVGSRKKAYVKAQKNAKSGVLLTADAEAAHIDAELDSMLSIDEFQPMAEQVEQIRAALVSYLRERGIKKEICQLVQYLYIDDGDTKADAGESNELWMAALKLTRPTFFRKKKLAQELLDDFKKHYSEQFD